MFEKIVFINLAKPRFPKRNNESLIGYEKLSLLLHNLVDVFFCVTHMSSSSVELLHNSTSVTFSIHLFMMISNKNVCLRAIKEIARLSINI